MADGGHQCNQRSCNVMHKAAGSAQCQPSSANIAYSLRGSSMKAMGANGTDGALLAQLENDVHGIKTTNGSSAPKLLKATVVDQFDHWASKTPNSVTVE
ncbi:uncharacterized protein PgNI_02553 [Pyricularia grisea]|uniref:Uncharacterized protein n=1 Tax=Pyricularia grisea TaxID=148305 RepID=A0A6P8BF58_PYRGI|nr:uncharacterized protein PgNI_02553 [Pyricularia grisea]TLD15456.1 hypothetical protein PgNI_02553 [Pyricularia grisea]